MNIDERVHSPLRAPGAPRKGDAAVPGYGFCTHPEHVGPPAWLVEGEILDGHAVGRCAKHREFPEECT